MQEWGRQKQLLHLQQRMIHQHVVAVVAVGQISAAAMAPVAQAVATASIAQAPGGLRAMHCKMLAILLGVSEHMPP
jgi:hypothetical protein